MQSYYLIILSFFYNLYKYNITDDDLLFTKDKGKIYDLYIEDYDLQQFKNTYQIDAGIFSD